MTEQRIKNLRLIIILISIVGFFSSFSITMTAFAYGIGSNTLLILLLFPTLFISAILVGAKIRVGFFLTLLTALAYAYVLTSDVGYFLVFDFGNSVLLTVLLLPYIAFLTLVPLTTIYLTKDLKRKNVFQIGAIILAFGIFIFSIADRQNKNYADNIFIDADINPQGQIILNCKPNFGDSRVFIMTTKSEALEEQIKKYGEYYQGSYFLKNTAISTNFNFTKFKSITIRKFGDHKLSPELTWTKSEINGKTNFLNP